MENRGQAVCYITKGGQDWDEHNATAKHPNETGYETQSRDATNLYLRH